MVLLLITKGITIFYPEGDMNVQMYQISWQFIYRLQDIPLKNKCQPRSSIIFKKPVPTANCEQL